MNTLILILMPVLAQTASAGAAEQAPALSSAEIISVVISLLLAGVAAWQRNKAWSYQTMFRAAAVGFKAALDSLPEAKAEEIKSEVKTDVLVAGGEKLNIAMKAEVKKAVEIKTENREDGLPKLKMALLPFLFSMALLSGCLNAGVHDAAVALRQSAATLDRSADILHRSSVPNPAYTTEERESWDSLWLQHQKSITEVQNAIRKLEEASR